MLVIHLKVNWHGSIIHFFFFVESIFENAEELVQPIPAYLFCVLNPSFFPQVSSLVLYVEEAHKLPVKYFTNPYCNIYLNSVQVAKTHPREGQNPVFTEEFIFEWVNHICACIIHICLPLYFILLPDISSNLSCFKMDDFSKSKKCMHLFQWPVEWNQQIWNQPEQQNKKEQRKRHL